jgi:uncharacterized membrane protein
MMTGVFASVPALVVLSSGHWAWPDLYTVFLALVGGALGILVYLPYLLALTVAPAASVTLMWNLTPVLIIVLAHVAIGERLDIQEYLGLSLLVISSAIAAVRLQRGRWLSITTFWMAVASVMLAVSSVFEKVVYERVTFTVGIGWISCGALLTTSVLLWLFATSRSRLIGSLRSGSTTMLIANQVLDLIAVCMLGLATSLAPVSLVHAIGGLQPMFVLVISWCISRSTEATAPFLWLRTALATALAIVGLALVHYTP